MNGFADAQVKGESQQIPCGDNKKPKAVETTYIEFEIPVAWEKECWKMIKAWIKTKEKA